MDDKSSGISKHQESFKNYGNNYRLISTLQLNDPEVFDGCSCASLTLIDHNIE